MTLHTTLHSLYSANYACPVPANICCKNCRPNIAVYDTGRSNITCSTVVLQCYRRQAIPMEQAKIRPSVTLYFLDRSLSTLVWLIMSVTPIVCQFWLNLVVWGIPRKYVKYNLSVTFCIVSLFFVHSPGAKTREQICTIDDSKRVKSGKDVPFGSFDKKISPHPQYPPNSQNFALRKQFFAQNTYKSWRKLHQNSYSNRK